MKIEVRSTNLELSEALESHAMRRLGFALRRYASRVDSVAIRIVDLNGPKGGNDKRCRVTARLTEPLPTVIAQATDADAYVAVSRAIGRLEDRIARALRRKREHAAQARVELARKFELRPLSVEVDSVASRPSLPRGAVVLASE